MERGTKCKPLIRNSAMGPLVLSPHPIMVYSCEMLQLLLPPSTSLPSNFYDTILQLLPLEGYAERGENSFFVVAPLFLPYWHFTGQIR